MDIERDYQRYMLAHPDEYDDTITRYYQTTRRHDSTAAERHAKEAIARHLNNSIAAREARLERRAERRTVALGCAYIALLCVLFFAAVWWLAS